MITTYRYPPTDSACEFSLRGLCSGNLITAIVVVVGRVCRLRVVAGRAVGGIVDGVPGVEHATNDVNPHI
jgi:hypothetical protein